MTPRIQRSRVTQERWLVSYADFITLLFAFFVVLYAFEKADHKKQAQIPVAIDAAFKSLGAFPIAIGWPASGLRNASVTQQAVIPLDVVMRENIVSPARVKSDLEQMRRELEQSLSAAIAQHTVSLQMGRGGLIISLREAGFFDSGSAVPHPETSGTLHIIADSLRRTSYNVRVEGHTDNVPIHNTDFDSNWELSSARATRIARLMLEINATPPERLSAAGYAEFHPIADNGTAGGRADNRRVDLVVMPRSEIDLSSPDPATSGPWKKVTDN